MKTVKMKKKKKIIFFISFIIAFIMLITIAYNSYSATKEYYLGDTNLDNQITLSDELLLLRHIYSLKSDKNENWRLSGDAVVNADINEDKKIDMSDVLYMKRYLLAQKDTGIAEKHTEWTKLCKKITKESTDIIKTYTLAIKPGDQTYTRETKTTMTVTAPEVSYTVSFNGNEGTSPDKEKSIRNFSNWILSGAGKVEDKKASPTTYTFGEGDATLTANYNKEGNSIILPNAKREEYVVEGWYDSKELKNKVGNVGDSYTPTQDITLYANWTKQKVEPTSVELNKKDVLIDISDNKTEKLTAKIVPANSNYNENLTWTSNNPSVAEVSKDGEIIGVSNGKATITVKTENGKSSTCEVTVQTSPTGVALDVTEKTIDLSGNKIFTIKPTIIPETANVNNKIKARTSDEKIATVTEQGEVTGVANGNAKITFYTENGRFATCNVNVVTSPTSISLDKTSISLDKDSSTYQLTAVIEPSTSNIKTELTWKSSNTNVATVSKNGLVTGKTTGTAQITVETGNGKTATCNVDVKIDQTEPEKPIQITLNKNTTTIDLSTTVTEKLVATTNSTEKLTWKSSNTNVATVSDDGLVTGKANGETTITVSTETGESATCEVTVQTSATGITINITEQTLDMSSEKTFRLTPTVIPPTANVNREIKINSSNPNVATISSNGTVTAMSNGTTIITFRLKNGKEAKCNVTVQTSPTSVSLNKTSVSLDSNSSTEQLVATINPATSNIDTGLTWNSSNSNVATVSSQGLVTAKATGTTQITVETENGRTATCDVDVKMDSTETSNLKLNKEAITIDLSESKTEKLIATTNAPGGLNWSSDNEDVATVSREGLVTGKANGQAIITVIDSSGEIVTCNVTVQTSPTGVALNVTEQTLDLNGTKTFRIAVDILPLTANVYTTLYIKSSNPNVATVTEDGTVTAVSSGKTTITIETENGKSATCEVTVLESQVEPTNIYFAENKDDATKYISVKKGESTTIKAVVEPSDAKSDITYSIISGNSRVANINSTTGEITGKQAGVVTVQAKTTNGLSTTIKVNVKIGNEAFDTYSTIKLRANTSNDLLYSKAVDFASNSAIGEASHFQTFAVASNGDIYYCSYPGGAIGTTNTSAKMNISIGHPNETPYKCMTLNYFGHGSGFDLEKGSGGGKVWIDSITQGNSNGKYDHGYAITRIQWANKSEYYFAAGTVKLKNTSGKVLKTYENSAGENFIFTTNGKVTTPLRIAIDETNRLMGIKKGNNYYVFDLDEALGISDKTYEIDTYIDDYQDCIVEVQAKDFSLIEPLTEFKIPSPGSEEDVTWHAWQGFDLDGDYIYIGEGGYTNKVTPTLWDYKAFVSVFDYMYAYNGNTLTKKKTEVAAVNDEWSASKKLLALMGDNGAAGNYHKAQLEGIRVTTQGGVKEMYLGFDSVFKSTGKRSANVLKYTY